MYTIIRRISLCILIAVAPRRFLLGCMADIRTWDLNVRQPGAPITWRIRLPPTSYASTPWKIFISENEWNGMFPSCTWIVKSVQEQRHITPVRDLGGIFTSKILTIWSRCPPKIVSVTLLENNPVKFASWNWQRYRYISSASDKIFTFVCESVSDHLAVAIINTVTVIYGLLYFQNHIIHVGPNHSKRLMLANKAVIVG